MCRPLLDHFTRWRDADDCLEPVYRCQDCGRDGYREHFDEQAAAIDRAVGNPLVFIGSVHGSRISRLPSATIAYQIDRTTGGTKCRVIRNSSTTPRR